MILCLYRIHSCIIYFELYLFSFFNVKFYGGLKHMTSYNKPLSYSNLFLQLVTKSFNKKLSEK